MVDLRRNNPSMASLPIDIIFTIIALLPIKCLFRLKTVCKSWYALINSSDFIKLHLHKNSISPSNQLLIFTTNDHSSLYSVVIDNLESPAMKVSFLNDSLSVTSIGGSCNGLLLCICNLETSKSDICLVNPSALQYRKIPKLQVPKNYVYVNYGLGYDFINDDYKVVRIVNFVCDCEDGSVFNAREVMVYSLRANSWKFIEEKISDYATLASRNGALVNNHLLHWMFWCISMNEHRISSFDVCSEKWDEVAMPNCFKKGHVDGENGTKLSSFDGEDRKLEVVHLGNFDGCLCLTTRDFRSYVGHIDIWVMKQYSVKDSWVKLYNMSDLNITRFLNIAPIDYTNFGREILLRNGKESSILKYDIREKRATNVEICGFSDYCDLSTCIQSIVPVNSYGTNDEECHQ